MTIKKIGLSTLAAAVVTTSAVAGTLSVTGGVNNVSSELLSVQAVDVNVTNGFTYVNGMTAASATEPGFELAFPGSTIVAAANADITIQDENNVTVARFNRVEGSSIIFDTVATTVINRAATYKVTKDDNVTTGIDATELQITMPQDSASASSTLTLYSNSGDSTLDTASNTVITARAQYSAAITTAYDAQIDASAGFLQFTSGTANVTDDFGWSFTNDSDNMPATAQATLTSYLLTVSADQNLTSYGATIQVGNADDNNVSDSAISYGVTTDANGTVADTANTTTVAPGTTAMDTTVFTASGVVTFDGGATKSLVSTSAGSWTIYGYTAQIPNVSGLSTHNTTFKFTNRSSLDTEIYFTLIDPDGTTVTLNSVANPTIADLPSDTTGTYKASNLVALITDPNFDATTSFSVEVSIPTTPTSVYGMASFKNTTLGQFKDLPVYNSGNSY